MLMRHLVAMYIMATVFYGFNRPGGGVMCERSIADTITSLFLRLSRYACTLIGQCIETLETFLTIGDDDDGKSAECCHGDSYVR